MLFASLFTPSYAAPALERWRGEIRNGSRVPQTVSLSARQQRAIGWFYNEVPEEPFCTGTLITPTLVLTARHCFEVRDDAVRSHPLPTQVGFAVGRNVEAPEESISLELDDPNTKVLHESLDLALIRLPRAFSDVTPIPINETRLEGKLILPMLGKQVEAVGFGRSELSRPERRFAAVRVALISKDSIFVDGEGQQGICEGDSGGPLIAPGADGAPKVFAVEFRGEGCCLGVDQLTRVDVARAWFRSEPSFVVSPGLELPEACFGVGISGSCQDGLLLSCRQELIEERCVEGEVCAYAEGRFRCIRPTEACAAVPPGGSCGADQEGDYVLRCLHGLPEQQRCAPWELCVSFEGRAGCLDPNEGFPACDSGALLARVVERQGAFTAVGGCAYRSPNAPAGRWLWLLGLIRLGISARRSSPRRRRAPKSP